MKNFQETNIIIPRIIKRKSKALTKNIKKEESNYAVIASVSVFKRIANAK